MSLSDSLFACISLIEFLWIDVNSFLSATCIYMYIYVCVYVGICVCLDKYFKIYIV